MITTILVALDSTPRAPGVLRLATEVAERFDARLFLFRALALAQAFPAAASNAGVPDALPAFLRQEALDELAALARGNPRASAAPPILVVAPPVLAILEAAERIGADLIVLGSHGFHGLDRLLGTTTGSVANRARHHVLIVHEN